METPVPGDPSERVRIAVLLVAVALNVWVMWDRPEFAILRHRATAAWRRWVTDPEKRARDLRRMEGEVVFEAMRTVEGE